MNTMNTPEPAEYKYWPRVYILVGIYTALLIAALAFFSWMYTA